MFAELIRIRSGVTFSELARLGESEMRSQIIAKLAHVILAQAKEGNFLVAPSREALYTPFELLFAPANGYHPLTEAEARRQAEEFIAQRSA